MHRSCPENFIQAEKTPSGEATTSRWSQFVFLILLHFQPTPDEALEHEEHERAEMLATDWSERERTCDRTD
jgi:hypothetical protein